MTGRTKVLVVDDELIVRESLIGWLRKSAIDAVGADGGAKALEILAREDFDLVLLDILMPDMNGIEVLGRIKEMCPDTMVVMITACGSVHTAVDAMKRGASDFLTKPLDPEEMVRLVDDLLHRKMDDFEAARRQEVSAGRTRCEDLIGVSACMQQLFDLIEEVARVESPVLLRGETGTGKELVAKAIHAMSERCFGPFIAINCGAFTETLLESELFGHETGAFTGATRARKGRLAMADGGTLFLDEVGEIPLKMQVDLLRVLEEKCFQQIGGVQDVAVDFRLISATNRDLAEEIERGSFRRDFYYRLNVIEIEIPPLRARIDDIPLLAEHFLDHFRRETNKPLRGIKPQGLALLKNYSWPGNVRELENAVERAVVLAKGPFLDKDDFSFLFMSGDRGASQSLKDHERQHIESVLKACGGNVSRAAEVLEVSRVTLHSKIKKYGLRHSSNG